MFKKSSQYLYGNLRYEIGQDPVKICSDPHTIGISNWELKFFTLLQLVEAVNSLTNSLLDRFMPVHSYNFDLELFANRVKVGISVLFACF